MNKPIILIGFKHVGKTTLGSALAEKLNTSFIDLDQFIESYYGQSAIKIGLKSFRSIESNCLSEVMAHQPGVLSLGGGTPLALENRVLIRLGTVVWIRSTKGRVYERIMISGRPSFFPQEIDAYQAFNQIWNERESIYKSLADHCVDNIGTVDEAISQILEQLKEEALA